MELFLATDVGLPIDIYPGAPPSQYRSGESQLPTNPLVGVYRNTHVTASFALAREKSSEMALPTLIGADGRAALPAFTCLDTLARWRAGARPVPVPATQVWRSGAQEASAVVIDVAGPVPFAVDGARLAALAEGRPAPMPYQDPDVMELVRGLLAGEPAIAGFRLLPGQQGTDLTLCLVPVAGATGAEVRAAAGRASAGVVTGAGDRVRRGIEVAVTGEGHPLGGSASCSAG